MVKMKKIPVGNVLAEEHVLKLDGVDTLVCLLNGFLKGICGSIGGNNTATSADESAIGQSSSGVEDNGI